MAEVANFTHLFDERLTSAFSICLLGPSQEIILKMQKLSRCMVHFLLCQKAESSRDGMKPVRSHLNLCEWDIHLLSAKHEFY